MKFSNFYVATHQNISKNITVNSYKLMLKTGLIQQLSSGVYTWMPLGVIVLRKLENLIRKEINKIGGVEIILPNLQPSHIWEKSGRLNKRLETHNQIFKIVNGNFILPPSGEEVATLTAKNSINSYKNIDKLLYQITWKFRDEIRTRYGTMRAKEFLMKDAYSFHMNQKNAMIKYESICRSYLKIFKKLEMNVIPVLAPSGDIGGNYSHEFHIISKSGESKIFYEPKVIDYLEKVNNQAHEFDLNVYQKFYAREEKKHDNNIKTICSHSSEIAHTFYLGEKYSSLFNFYFNIKNKKHYIKMGCYGIGITRLIACIVEYYHDNKGLTWPIEILPFKFGLINRNPENNECNETVKKIEAILKEQVLYLNHDASIKKKIYDIDLIGIPQCIFIEKEYLKQNIVRIKNRGIDKIKFIDYIDFINNLI